MTIDCTYRGINVLNESDLTALIDRLLTAEDTIAQIRSARTMMPKIYYTADSENIWVEDQKNVDGQVEVCLAMDVDLVLDSDGEIIAQLRQEVEEWKTAYQNGCMLTTKQIAIIVEKDARIEGLKNALNDCITELSELVDDGCDSKIVCQFHALLVKYQ